MIKNTSIKSSNLFQDNLNIDTPSVIINRDTAMRNIKQFQKFCDNNQINFRPHIKTHKLIAFAKAQLAAGAVGINCQKIGEAEVMAEGGIDNILITYNILGKAKLNRLYALFNKGITLSVTADSAPVVTALSDTFKYSDLPLNVLVECDTGANRCGVQTPKAALKLAQQIEQLPGLKFGGLMTYPPKGAVNTVQKFMNETLKLLTQKNINCSVITSGGTPDMWSANQAPIITEYRAGTYIYNDRSLVAQNVCTWRDCALSILTTVVSVPKPGRAIIDAGSKSLSSDLLGLDGYGSILGREGIGIIGLSEEHGHLAYSETAQPLHVGERLHVIPNHACVVSNLTDQVVLVSNDQPPQMINVDARGLVK